MAHATRPNLHRKFIAFVLMASLAVTGFSAAPARADEDVAKVIAGLAALAIIGAAINKNRHENNNNYVTQYPHKPTHVHPKPRPLPPRVARYDLPSQCLRQIKGDRSNHKMLGAGCLNKRYGYANSLPSACRVKFWNGHRNKTAYRPTCLTQRGYRIVRY